MKTIEATLEYLKSEYQFSKETETKTQYDKDIMRFVLEQTSFILGSKERAYNYLNDKIPETNDRYYKDITYNVFCNSVYDSDVVDCGTLEEAEKVAKEWSNGNQHEIIIEKVETEYIKSYQNGKEMK